MAKDVISELNELIKLDLGAIKAYDQAIDACDHPTIKGTLETFKKDHERHVTDLSAQVVSLGGTVETEQGLMGRLIEGFTAVASRGDQSALFAMRGNEELTNKRYSSALGEALPEGVRAVVEKNFEDEKRHLEWIKDALDKHIWERKAA
ncbi:MAG: DUF2383 domain-containing protein [Polyangiaceae bacterium]|nr:DUF2383 domain-containing protein [Polyangiaceae bacterium]